MAAINRDFAVDDMASMLDLCAASRGVVVQASNSRAETHRLLAMRSPRVAGVVGWMNLAGDVSAELASMPAGYNERLVGIRHLAHIDPDPEWLLRGDVGNGLATLGARDLTFDFVVRAWQLGQVESVAQRDPGTTFVIDHLGAPPVGTDQMTAWATSLSRVARHQNVSVKLSGLPSAFGADSWGITTFNEAFDVALDSFGPDRMMYGSDWPLVELGGGAERWLEAVSTLVASLTESEQASIWHGCATRQYGLETAS
jgi:L-fuconolactonase